MAYDRYDTRDAPRGERSRWRDDDRFGGDRGWRGQDRGSSGGRDDRGFFERAGDEIASWFGDEDAERRRRQDQRQDGRTEQRGYSGSGGQNRDYDRGYGRDWDRDRNSERSAFSSGDAGNFDRGNSDWDRDRSRGPGRYEDWNDNRGAFARGGSSERDYDRNWRQEFSGDGARSGRNQGVDRWVEENNRDFGRHNAERGRGSSNFDRDSFRSRDQYSGGGSYQRDSGSDRNRGSEGSSGYRPMTGDYGRSSGSGYSESNWERDPYRDTSRAGTANKSDRSREDRFDPHYASWRDRHMSDLDRDYDDYRAEHQSKFESDFGSWRERRQQKRGLLGQIRENMEVVGKDKEHVGTVDKTAGDRLILTKSDDESGGIHHSISCSDIDRVEGDKVILDCTADEARNRWRDESRGRALFEGEDQGEMGPRNLNRSFEGTYR
jgi:hypothetical protein